MAPLRHKFAPRLSKKRRLPALKRSTIGFSVSFGSFILTGEAATFKWAEIVSNGSFTLTGEAVVFYRNIVVSFGQFTLTGIQTTGVVTSIGTFSTKDPNLMIVLAFSQNTKVLMDFDENEFYYLSQFGLYNVTPFDATRVFQVQTTKVYNPWYGVGWAGGPPRLGTK
jgi:hypothetical protein